MKHNFTVFLLAGGFGTSFQMMYPSIPKALIPLGHNPCICILLETLLEIGEIDCINVLVFERHLEKFKKEISRWFFNHNIINVISLPDTQGTSKSIEYMLEKHAIENENILILHSNMPLISKITLQDMMNHFIEQKENLMCLVSKLKNTENERAVVKNNEQIIDISTSASSEYSYLNTIAIKLSLLKELIPKIDCTPDTNEYNIHDIVKLAKKSAIYNLNPYTANKECVMIKKTDDKNFAEEIYMEHRNANFIHQCYGLWKKCDIFENRLQFLESIVERNKLV